MTQREAIKRIYGIEDGIILGKLVRLRDAITNIVGKEWSVLFVLDILANLMMYSNVIDLIDENITDEYKNNFGKRVEVLFNIVSMDQLIEMIGNIINLEPPKTKSR